MNEDSELGEYGIVWIWKEMKKGINTTYEILKDFEKVAIF